MSLHSLNKTHPLTTGDEDLIGRIAYAMVVAGVWQKVVRRTEAEFDFVEIRRPGEPPAYRIGRLASGVYVHFNLMTGIRKYGASLAELLKDIAYVPQPR